MSFLQRHGTLVSPDAHSCSWVSAVFAEQDDDMMESAKALIALYLYQKRFGIGFISPVIMDLYTHLYFFHLMGNSVLISIAHTALMKLNVHYLNFMFTIFTQMLIIYELIYRYTTIRIGVSRIQNKVSSAHQGCIYLIKNTAKTVNNLKELFCILIYCKIKCIAVIKAEFSASLPFRNHFFGHFGGIFNDHREPGPRINVSFEGRIYMVPLYIKWP